MWYLTFYQTIIFKYIELIFKKMIIWIWDWNRHSSSICPLDGAAAKPNFNG